MSSSIDVDEALRSALDVSLALAEDENKLPGERLSAVDRVLAIVQQTERRAHRLQEIARWNSPEGKATRELL